MALPELAEDHNFQLLLPMSREELIVELVETATYLANLSMRIGFLRAEEIRNPSPHTKSERAEWEQVRVAYEEKKWVIINLLGLRK